MAQRGGGGEGMRGGGHGGGGGMMSPSGGMGMSGAGMSMGGGRCGGMNSGNNGMQAMNGMINGNSMYASNSAANQVLASQMMANQGQTMPRCQNSFGNSNPTLNAAQARPTASQFVQRAMSFDSNGDGELNARELTQVATAVVAELRRRQPRSNSIASNSFFRIKQGASIDSLTGDSTINQMANVFVSKALVYDKDASGTLDARETKAMASALSRAGRWW